MCAIYLYIPIWLYSNDREVLRQLNATHFTFQSGYIQISCFLDVCNFFLTLHSNLVIFKLNKEKGINIQNELYIPIWLYSNKVRKQWSNVPKIFTFQSGYIQIWFRPRLPLSFLPLHSNLVIFKYHSNLNMIGGCLALHSNLVIFKLVKRM